MSARAGAFARVLVAVVLSSSAATAVAADGACDYPDAPATWTRPFTEAWRWITRADPPSRPVAQLPAARAARPPATAVGVPFTADGTPGFRGVRLVARGRSHRISVYGTNALSAALCEPHRERFPYTYEAAESTLPWDTVVTFRGGLTAMRTDGGAYVRSVSCLREPY